MCTKGFDGCNTHNGFDGILYNKAVNDYLDVMLFVLIYLYLLGQLIGYPVDPCPYKARLHTSFKFLCMFALSSPDNGGEYLYLSALLKGHHLIHYLIYGLMFYLPAAHRAMGHAYTGVQKTQVVVYLRHGTYCGTGVF